MAKTYKIIFHPTYTKLIIKDNDSRIFADTTKGLWRRLLRAGLDNKAALHISEMYSRQSQEAVVYFADERFVSPKFKEGGRYCPKIHKRSRKSYIIEKIPTGFTFKILPSKEGKSDTQLYMDLFALGCSDELYADIRQMYAESPYYTQKTFMNKE